MVLPRIRSLWPVSFLMVSFLTTSQLKGSGINLTRLLYTKLARCDRILHFFQFSQTEVYSFLCRLIPYFYLFIEISP